MPSWSMHCCKHLINKEVFGFKGFMLISHVPIFQNSLLIKKCDTFVICSKICYKVVANIKKKNWIYVDSLENNSKNVQNRNF